MSYFDSLVEAKDQLVEELLRRGIEKRYLAFGGAGEPPVRRPTVPTDARSEFLANRAMGDWAEGLLAEAMEAARRDWKVVHYGSSERIAAGDPGFRDFYLQGLEEVRIHGKRPDLLVLPAQRNVPADTGDLGHEEAQQLAHDALAAVEVRSSKHEALTYVRVRRRQQQDGKRGIRMAPSFTVKVEDLRIVYRWIERTRVPQSYCQVFFDVVYCMNFLDIFREIASGKRYTIDRPKKSQEKATIMVPITLGREVGQFTKPPTYEAAVRVTRLGRHDAYVVPKGGELTLDGEALREVLIP